MPEGEVPGAVAGDVEPVGIREDRRVAVRGQQADLHELPRRDLGSGDHHRLGGVAHRGDRERAFVAQHFLDRAGHQAGVGAQRGELLGVGEQGVDAVGYQVDGGLVAGHHQQEGHRGDLLLGEPVLAVTRREQAAEQVVGRVLALVPDQRLDVFEHRLGGHDGHFAVAATALGDRVAPDLEGLVLVLRSPEQVEDHRDRQRQREFGDQVGLVLARQPIEQPIDMALDQRPHTGHPPHGVGLLHQLAQPGVVRRVGVEHVAHQRLAGTLGEADQVAVPLGRAVLAQPRIRERRPAVGVARDQPALDPHRPAEPDPPRTALLPPLAVVLVLAAEERLVDELRFNGHREPP
nr:hypothetical protein [Kitasatospora acidiphila]